MKEHVMPLADVKLGSWIKLRAGQCAKLAPRDAVLAEDGCVKPKASVKFDAKEWTVKGRFTAHKAGGLVPSVALEPKGHKAKNRHAPAKAVSLAS